MLNDESFLRSIRSIIFVGSPVSLLCPPTIYRAEPRRARVKRSFFIMLARIIYRVQSDSCLQIHWTKKIMRLGKSISTFILLRFFSDGNAEQHLLHGLYSHVKKLSHRLWRLQRLLLILRWMHEGRRGVECLIILALTYEDRNIFRPEKWLIHENLRSFVFSSLALCETRNSCIDSDLPTSRMSNTDALLSTFFRLFYLVENNHSRCAGVASEGQVPPIQLLSPTIED